MATVVANQPLDLLAPGFFPGTDGSTPLAAATGEEASFREPDGTLVYLGGNFSVSGGDVVAGTITSLGEESPATGDLYSGSGFDLDWADYLGFRAAGDSFGFVFRLLRGDDQIFGSDGPDRLVGFDGADELEGGRGDDDVNGNVGADTVSGGNGRDFVRGGRDDDLVRGGNGDDWHVNGNIGNDTVYGDGGSDTVFGGQNADMLFGDYGDRSGFGGNDRLHGNLGRDSLYGEDGNDTLEGGDGFDVFFFQTAGGDDHILDFALTDDLIAIESGINGSILEEGAPFSVIQGRLAAVGTDTILDLGNGDTVTIVGIQPAQLQASHFFYFDA
ncbi:calcium-binding protein [Stella sp.]|uniref:calcium-binding protein n=1 Tax=Stella sp. TaxID=2912054 RepID=UPI0035AFBC0F